MSDPDQITVTLSREEAEVLRSIEAPAGPARFKCPECREIAEKAWRRDFALHNAAVAKLRTALDNPQPNTERYEEALREIEAIHNRPAAAVSDFIEQSEAARKVARAAPQPTGEKHG